MFDRGVRKKRAGRTSSEICQYPRKSLNISTASVGRYVISARNANIVGLWTIVLARVGHPDWKTMLQSFLNLKFICPSWYS